MTDAIGNGNVTANTPASRKAKGSRLERKVAELIRRKKLDPKAQRMPLSGAWSHLPADIYTSLDIHIECKNQERVKLWEWWNKIRDKRNPILCISGNHRPILAVVDVEYLLDLLKIEQEYLEEVSERAQ